MTGPLHGLKVIDFGRYIAGPFCAALLGDLGADVIRVEKREGREDRTLVPLAKKEDGTPREGAMFLQMNRNKRSLVLDPMHEAGREVVKRLIRSADVVIANLPGETLKAMGLDYETIVADQSPRRGGGGLRVRTGRALCVARGVSMAWRRRCLAPHIFPAPTNNRCDVPRLMWISGRHRCWPWACSRLCRSRDQTGKGQLVEGALLRTALTYFSPTLIEESVLEIDRTPSLNRSQTAGPSDIFRTKRWMDHRGGERRSIVSPRLQTDRRAGMDRRSALCVRQNAWRQWRDHLQACWRMVRFAQQRGSDRSIRESACSSRARLSTARDALPIRMCRRAVFSPRSIFPASARHRLRQRR